MMKRPWWTVRVPEALLTDRGLSAGAQLLYMRLLDHCQHSTEPVSLGELTKMSGLASRTTAQRYATALEAGGWLTVIPGRRGRTYQAWQTEAGEPGIELPGLLIGSMPPIAVALYARLAMWRQSSGSDWVTQQAGLLEAAGCASQQTLRRYLQPLEEAGWLERRFVSRAAGTAYVAADPHLQARQRERGRVRQRLNRAPFRGEALMQEMLTAIIGDSHLKNARLAAAANPLTGESVEFDLLFHVARVAFEFDRPRHDQASELFPDATDEQLQEVRELVKTALARELGITLRVVQARDLTFAALASLAEGLLPVRALRRRDPVIRLLEDASRAYRVRARRAGAQAQLAEVQQGTADRGHARGPGFADP